MLLGAGLGVAASVGVASTTQAEQAVLSVSVQVVSPCMVGADMERAMAGATAVDGCGTVAAPRLEAAMPSLVQQTDAIRSSLRAGPSGGPDKVLTVIY
ncbi:hypothetical protein [Marinivivus vitaminiproducens]|uniref:hypothetical protein n=1 Tax=Marinivivus vitaminiproducens TaxID=3035935 RepID=UPI0027A36A59|nr:hypothetical protein P4R82_06920 [Geminicoccaceae bacterium SCSIO 64248]